MLQLNIERQPHPAFPHTLLASSPQFNIGVERNRDRTLSSWENHPSCSCRYHEEIEQADICALKDHAQSIADLRAHKLMTGPELVLLNVAPILEKPVC